MQNFIRVRDGHEYIAPKVCWFDMEWSYIHFINSLAIFVFYMWSIAVSFIGSTSNKDIIGTVAVSVGLLPNIQPYARTDVNQCI